MKGIAAAASGSDEGLRDIPPDEVIFGRSPVMRELKNAVARVAAARISVLVHGENGTGKEVMAKLIHLQSPWRTGRFVKVCCAAIPATLLEAELFGYEKGAFTGASYTKPGRIEVADGGTLLLDEIGELAVELQAKLLQFLQDGLFSRIGAQEQRRVRVRVICTTNRHLDQEIADGTFRQDLFYRINGVALRIPPLRERSEDIPGIAQYLVKTYNRAFSTEARPLTPKMRRQLQKHRWPGNIRELENVIRRYVLLRMPEAITDQVQLRPSTSVYFEVPVSGNIALKLLTQRAIHELEAKVILNVLRSNNWNRKRTAEALQISYRALLYKIQNAGISAARPGPDRKPTSGNALDSVNADQVPSRPAAAD